MKHADTIEMVNYLAVVGAYGLKRGPVKFLQCFPCESEDTRQLFIDLVHARNIHVGIEGLIDVFDRQG